VSERLSERRWFKRCCEGGWKLWGRVLGEVTKEGEGCPLGGGRGEVGRLFPYWERGKGGTAKSKAYTMNNKGLGKLPIGGATQCRERDSTQFNSISTAPIQQTYFSANSSVLISAK
jgi:hypothetical protein